MIRKDLFNQSALASVRLFLSLSFAAVDSTVIALSYFLGPISTNGRNENGSEKIVKAKKLGICSFCGKDVPAEELTPVNFKLSEGGDGLACSEHCLGAATNYWFKIAEK